MLTTPPHKLSSTCIWNIIISFAKKNSLIRNIYYLYLSIKSKDIFCKMANVENHGYGSFKKMIEGKNNSILIGKNTRMRATAFRIRGENNMIEIGDNCTIGIGCSFWIEGNNVHIKVGANTTFTQYVHFNAQENGSYIECGEGCMFSNHIIVRTSDAHPIYDISTGKRINFPKPIVIGKEVWVAPDTKIMKGAIIGDGSIIGSKTMVSKELPPHSLAVGMPAKVVRQAVKWTREDILFS